MCLFERIKLTTAARDVLQKALTILSTTSLQGHNPELPLLAIILWTSRGFLGALWQGDPLMWLHQAHSDLQKVTSKFDQLFQLGLKAHYVSQKDLWK